MLTFLSTGLSVLRGCHVRPLSLRPILRQAITCLLIGLPSFLVYSLSPRSTLRYLSSPRISKKYNCTGGSLSPSEGSRKILDQAIRDARALLKKCEPCRNMFLRFENPIELLDWLDQGGHIVMTSKYPGNEFHPPHPKSVIFREEELTKFDNKMGAVTLDLLGGRSGEMEKSRQMRRPCIYINSNEFMAVDIPAEGFALYRVPRAEGRAIGIIHELGHVAGLFAVEGNDPGSIDKSLQTTDCVRKNCFPCKMFDFCTGLIQEPPPRIFSRKGVKGQ